MNRLLAAALALFLAAPAVAVAQVNPSNMPANSVFGRLGIGPGPGQAIPLANLIPLLPFTNGVVIRPTVNTLTSGLTIGQTAAGTTAVGGFPLNSITATETINNTNGGNNLVSGFTSTLTSAATSIGARTAIEGIVQVGAAQTAAGMYQGTGVTGVAQLGVSLGGTGVTSGTASGSIFGTNALVSTFGTAANLFAVVGSEVDVSLGAGTSAYLKTGILIVQSPTDAVQGSGFDFGIGLSSGVAPSSSLGWKVGLAFNASAGQQPISTTGTLIGTNGAATVGSVLDTSSYTVSNYIVKANGVRILGTGAVSINSNNPTSVADPQTQFDINNNAAALAAPVLNSIVRLGAVDAGPAEISGDSFGSSTVLAGRRADGTNASKTGLVANDVITSIQALGWTSAGAYTTTNSAAITLRAAETWSATANGTSIFFATTPNTTAALATAMTIQNSGGISIGVGTADPGIGKLAVTTAYNVGSTQVVAARITGYTAMTGTPDKATAFATSSVTLAQLAGRVMQLQADFTTHGLIGP